MVAPVASAQENVETVRAFIEAFNSGDVDRMEALCTDNHQRAAAYPYPT